MSTFGPWMALMSPQRRILPDVGMFVALSTPDRSHSYVGVVERIDAEKIVLRNAGDFTVSIPYPHRSLWWTELPALPTPKLEARDATLPLR